MFEYVDEQKQVLNTLSHEDSGVYAIHIKHVFHTHTDIDLHTFN